MLCTKGKLVKHIVVYPHILEFLIKESEKNAILRL